MRLSTKDLEYIKESIEWINDNNQLIDINKSNQEIHCNLLANSLSLLNSAISEESEDIFSANKYKECGKEIPEGYRFCCVECKFKYNN